jgi:transposase
MRIKTGACASFFRTRRASGRRGACATSGGSAASDACAETVADDEHVALVLDGAGWHSGKSLRVPENITLVPLPAYSPELNPVERVWLYLKQRFLSLRLHNDYEEIVAAASKAWKRLCRDTGRLASLTAYPWIMKVKP